ncbi:hypothetical protein MHK_005985, partial [Candidatus Magnetomorum sp. HK-1]
ALQTATMTQTVFLGDVTMNQQLTVNGDLQSTGITNTGNLSTDKLTLNQTMINSTGTEINYLIGVTANVQTQIAHIQANLNTRADSDSVLKKDGSIPLTANWDSGNYKISANQLESNAASDTAPLIVNSTTKVSNLNADLIHFSYRVALWYICHWHWLLSLLKFLWAYSTGHYRFPILYTIDLSYRYQ